MRSVIKTKFECSYEHRELLYKKAKSHGLENSERILENQDCSLTPGAFVGLMQTVRLAESILMKEDNIFVEIEMYLETAEDGLEYYYQI